MTVMARAVGTAVISGPGPRAEAVTASARSAVLECTVVDTPSAEIRVTSDCAEILEAVRDVFSGGVPGGSQDGRHNAQPPRVFEIRTEDPEKDYIYARVSLRGRDLFLARTPAELLNRLENSISDALARSLTGFQLFHSGAVARNGVGVLIPGASGAGKSTTTAALAMAGFEYLSDDIAVLGTDGRVRPFPKVMALKSGGSQLIRERFQAAAGRVVGNTEQSAVTYIRPPRIPDAKSSVAGIPVRLVLLPRRDEPGAPLLQKVSKSAVVTCLVEESLDLELLGRRAVDVIVDIVRRADCYALNVRDIDAAVEVVTGLTE